MSDYMLSGAIAAQHLAYSFSNGGDQLGIGDLLPVQITDVKDIKYLIHLGGNLGDPDIQVASEQTVSDPVKKPREVIGIDFNDSEKIRATVVHDNFIRLQGCAFDGGLVGPSFSSSTVSRARSPLRAAYKSFLTLAQASSSKRVSGGAFTIKMSRAM